jgi:hypothetical protein
MSFGLGLRGEEMRVDPPGRLSPADSTITWIDSPRFWQHRLGSQIFKVPETAHVETYYWELNEPAEEPFRSLVLREGLTGMRFEELYTDEWPF